MTDHTPAMPPLKTDITNEALWEFPLHYPVKVMGEAHYPLRETVTAILQKHAPGFNGELSARPSSSGKYLSISATVYVERKEQINGMYADFAAHPHIKMAL